MNIIQRTDTESYSVSTAIVECAYSTAISHESFNDGDWIVFAEDGTIQSAMASHQKALDFLATNPQVIMDVSQTRAAHKLDAVSAEWRMKERQYDNSRQV
jgi:hypothetical protein